MRIQVEVIPPAAQRYPTTGDWVWGHGDNLLIRASQMPDYRYVGALVIHELVEALLCKQDGVTGEEVDAWDMGPGKDLEDPGSSPECPYHKQHVVALLVEKVFLQAAGRTVPEFEAALKVAYNEGPWAKDPAKS